MISLSAHGLRGSPDPSRRGFLIAMMGAGVMLGYARSGLTAPASHHRNEIFFRAATRCAIEFDGEQLPKRKRPRP